MNGVQLSMIALPLGLFVAMLFAATAGHRIAAWRSRLRDDASAVGTSAVDAAVLGLLGLLVAFWFSSAGTRHRAAFNAHTPVAILALVLLVAIFAAVLAGHDMAGQGRFNWLHIVVFAAVVSLTIWVIYDLEMPRYGLIRIDNYDQTLLDLRDSIQCGP